MSDVTTAEFNEEGKYLRKVRSFVLREGRLTKGQATAIEQQWSLMGLDYSLEPLDLVKVFGREADTVLEIGFGMGASLVEMAKASPELNFIGIEVHKPGVGSCLSVAAEAGVTNLRVFHHDAVEVLENSIFLGSLARVQLFFPDPWHKARHHKRRIVQPEFVQTIRNALKVGGVFHLATDWDNYSEHMLEVLNDASGYKNKSTTGDVIARPAHRPLTKFEARGHRLGHGVWDIMFERTV